MDDPGFLRHAAVIEFADAPIAWFYESLGFSSRSRVEIPNEDYIATLSGGAIKRASIRKYANAWGSLIEIISLPVMREGSVSWNHVAVSVGDCDRVVDQVVREGALLVGGPVRSTSGPYVVAYVRDPSGNLVELVQRLTDSDENKQWLAMTYGALDERAGKA